MAKSQKHKILFIILLILLIVVAGIGSYAFWLSHHYRHVIKEQLPRMVTRATDSIYHISIGDIDVSLYNHEVTITNLKLWPNVEQAKLLQQQHRYTPLTLSTVSIPKLVATGVAWEHILSNKSLDCENIVVHQLKWLMVCRPNPADSLYTRDKAGARAVTRVTAAQVHFINPDVTYHYKGPDEDFTAYMKDGKAELDKFVFDCDPTKDTTTFLYAHSGKIRFESFIFSKPTGRYTIKTPDIDFITTPSSVILKSVKIRHMVDNDPKTGKEIEFYNFNFPEIEMIGFNWNKLIIGDELFIPKINARDVLFDIHHIRKNAVNNRRTGAFPNQLLLRVRLKTNLKEVNLKNAHIKYTEITPSGGEGVIEFTGIHGRFNNVTNIPSEIERYKSCVAKLTGKFMNKSEVSATFDLSLTDKRGGYKVDGTVENLTGDEVTPQAQVFTLVKVTSFHLTKMDMHIQGDENYGKGDFTVFYEDLKISLFKFNTKMRDGKHGLFAFVGSNTVLYPSNPMPGKDPRNVTTSFVRDTAKGFIGTIWQHMYRAAKKTAVRKQAIITLTDDPETQEGDKPRKGFLKRLFGKKNN